MVVHLEIQASKEYKHQENKKIIKKGYRLEMETLASPEHSLRIAQGLRLRRALMSLGAGFANSSIIFSASLLGYIEWSQEHLALYMLISSLGFASFPLLIHRQLNLHWRDPSLTQYQIGWHLFVTGYAMTLAPEIRSLLMINLLLIFLFTVFRYSSKRLPWLALGFVSCYLLALVLHTHLKLAEFNWQHELFIGQVFLLALIGTSLISAEIAGLRAALKKRNVRLAQAMQRIEELAVTDELTGLYNRRHLMRILKRQKGLSDRSDYIFSIGFIDLDHFKQINDTFGHDAGDLALKSVADAVRTSLREVDYIARLGGEEFVIILAQADMHAAIQMAEHLRHDIERLVIPLGEDRPDLMLTASIGVATYHSEDSIEELMRRADQALYAAKECGRNCTLHEQDLRTSPLKQQAEQHLAAQQQEEDVLS